VLLLLVLALRHQMLLLALRHQMLVLALLQHPVLCMRSAAVAQPAAGPQYRQPHQ
jgi:hypothetical protein